MYVMKFKIKASVHAMIKTLPEDELVEIRKVYIPGAEKEREFIHDGKYFDVAKHRIVGDSIHYHCYFDKDETDLAHLSSQWHSIDLVKDKRIQPSYLVKVSDIKYVQSDVNFNTFFSLSNNNFNGLIFSKYIVFRDVLSPPPRFLINICVA